MARLPSLPSVSPTTISSIMRTPDAPSTTFGHQFLRPDGAPPAGPCPSPERPARRGLPARGRQPDPRRHPGQRGLSTGSAGWWTASGTGSRARASLEAAIDWILAEMKKDGLQNVRGEPVKVTRWVRGEESAVLVRPRRDTLAHARAGRQRGDAEGGDHRAGAGGARASRSWSSGRRRPAARSCCSTCRSPTTPRPAGAIAPTAPRPPRARERWRA